MEDVIRIEAKPDPRPYGLFGLLLSLGGIGGIVLVVLALGLAPLLANGVEYVLILGCALYLAAIFAIWAMARLRAGPAWALLVGWTPCRLDRTFWALLAASIAYGPMASLVVNYFNPAFKPMFTLPDDLSGIAAGLFLVVVLAPLSEELLFRGWIYTALRWRFGFSAALWASAIIFALAHWESTHLYALVILPIGLVLGYLRERTGSTRATTLFHMIYNFSGLALSFLGKL